MSRLKGPITKTILLYKNANPIAEARMEQNEFRKNGKFCDWSLNTEDGGKFLVHKLVLASNCPFFRGLLQSDMIETNHEEMLLPMITAEMLNCLLNYIYIGEIEITINNMKDIFKHSSFLGLSELEAAARKFIQKNITNDNYLELWDFSELYGELEKEICNYIVNYAINLLESPEIQDLSLDKITKLMAACDSNTKTINHEHKYKLMANWMSKDFTKREPQFKSLLDQIDFTKINQQFLITVITPNVQFKKNIDFLLKLVDLHKMNYNNGYGRY